MPEKCKATNAFLVNWFCLHVSHLFSPSYTFFLSSVFWLKKHTNSVKRLLRQIQNIKLSVVYFFAHLNKNILFNYRNLKKQVNACLVHLCCLCQTCNCIISFGNDIILRYCLALYKFIYILNDSAYIRTYIYIAIERKNNKSSPFCKKKSCFWSENGCHGLTSSIHLPSSTYENGISIHLKNNDIRNYLIMCKDIKFNIYISAISYLSFYPLVYLLIWPRGWFVK